MSQRPGCFDWGRADQAEEKEPQAGAHSSQSAVGETESWEAGVGGCVGTTVATTKCKETILQGERPVVKRSALFTSVTFASCRLAPVPALRRLQLFRELRTEDTHAQASDPWPSRAGGKDSQQ